MNTGKDPLLSVQNLSIPLEKGSDRKFAVEDVSFELHAGEILCIVGESGSGKSMSANAILGLLPLISSPAKDPFYLKARIWLRRRKPS